MPETLTPQEVDLLRQTIWRMAEDINRMKRVCAEEHPPKMASPTRVWEVGTETRHSDGSRCVLLNDGDWHVITPSTEAAECGAMRACVGYTIRTDGTGSEHDVDRSNCSIHADQGAGGGGR